MKNENLKEIAKKEDLVFFNGEKYDFITGHLSNNKINELIKKYDLDAIYINKKDNRDFEEIYGTKFHKCLINKTN